jgi:hypothetical protein
MSLWSTYGSGIKEMLDILNLHAKDWWHEKTVTPKEMQACGDETNLE